MAVRVKLDENIPKDAGALLRGAGHDVETVLDERLGGNPDAKVFATCQGENRVLITFDLDFSDIRLYPPSNHNGIWILRPHAKRREHACLVEGCPGTRAERSRASSAMDC